MAEVFHGFTIGDDGAQEIHIIEPGVDRWSEFRPIGFFIDGRWCMFEKPGELVAVPLPVLPV